jgi:tRNA A37 N6-isopentenylltransferase MiaA
MQLTHQQTKPFPLLSCRVSIYFEAITNMMITGKRYLHALRQLGWFRNQHLAEKMTFIYSKPKSE